MYAPAHIRNLTKAAATLGVVLPAGVGAVLAHSETIGYQVRAAAVSEPVVTASLLTHLGKPDTLKAAIPKALDALVRSTLAGSLAAKLETRAVTEAWAQAKRNGEAIAAAFGQAIQPALDVLNDQAKLVPSWASDTRTSDLTPDAFAAYKACVAAEATIATAIAATVPLYPVLADNALELEAGRRVATVTVPDRLDYPSAWAFVRALAGRRPLNNTVSHTLEATSPWWAAVAELGGRFAWAGPAATGDRATRLSKACVPPVRDDSSPGQPRVMVLP